ncbi:class I SAM-dependent DNA methyltransferase [Oceanobacillus chungangensis]|uniref:Uncharacterized methyltransferase CWR45_07295 n=1 Tax=Oceanobacillus chungangensis TaxID=1229152 RepID=A0A3D8PXJ2_9BACI|nr:class I SAM-dependent methyltransferase [Oceanobacillus chungangensis]RDW19859.1 SAM-dependent methyltransferase [Oceanobacillus chungangensis]
MGREFIEIFEEWAKDYDDSVAGQDPQYAAVFANYEGILNEVVALSAGTVLEFGVGTGNLSEKLIHAGLNVIGIEPSLAMLNIAKEKLPELTVLEGDFLTYPVIDTPVNTIVSTYAFHHLTDDEKLVAAKQFSEILEDNGRIVFGDTMFASEIEKQAMISDAKEKGFFALAEDLQREYYPIIDTLEDIFTTNGFDVQFKQMNHFVWILTAIKNNSVKSL